MSNTNLTYVVNSDQKADILFQNILDNDTFFPPDNYEQVVFFVPFCANSDEVRHHAKRYRAHYGPDKFFLVDIDETYPVHHRAKLQHNVQTPTALLVENFLENREVSAQILVDK